MSISVKLNGQSVSEVLCSLTSAMSIHKLIKAMDEKGVKWMPSFFTVEAILPNGSKPYVKLKVGLKTLTKYLAGDSADLKAQQVVEAKASETMFRAFILDVACKVMTDKGAFEYLYGYDAAIVDQANWKGAIIGTPDLPAGPLYLLPSGVITGMAPVAVASALADALSGFTATASTPAAPQKPAGKPVVDLTVPVKLSEASKVGQRVFGTSSGSTYICIGVGQAVKLAARYESGGLSFRVEGKPVSMDLRARLKTLGFKDSQSYLSMHLMNVTPDKVNRTLGSVLYGTELAFIEKANNAEVLL